MKPLDPRHTFCAVSIQSDIERRCRIVTQADVAIQGHYTAETVTLPDPIRCQCVITCCELGNVRDVAISDRFVDDEQRV